MAISPQAFPPRKRRPSAGSFISPNFSDLKLVQSLLLLSQDISSLKPVEFLLKKSSCFIIREANILVVLFEEILRNPIFYLPHSAVLCFKEIYIVLQRIKALLEDCSNGSKIWLSLQHESVSDSLHELMAELSTLLEIFPLETIDLNEDVKELVVMIRKQCWNTRTFVDLTAGNLRDEILMLLDQIKSEIVPEYSKLSEVFGKLGLRDSESFKSEIESLKDEVHNQVCKKSMAEMIALVGLVRYAKCVLLGASTPRSDSTTHFPATDVNFPADFRCPITLELMQDPVVIATGQTYDRTSINRWIDSGHNTCPKTGQTLVHMNLIPNCALKNLIALWCREQKIPFEKAETNDKVNGVTANKAALEATKMTALFLINKLSLSPTPETANRIIHELRILAKADSDSRACIAEAGAIPLLVRYLTLDNPSLQVNAVTTILNLSILEANKTRIIETNGAVDGVIEVLTAGATWEAKGNAAATIFSLSGPRSYRKKFGRKTRAIQGLIELSRSGPTTSKRDALVAILNLAGDRETVGRLVEQGVVEMLVEVMTELPEEVVAVLSAVAKRGGAEAISETPRAVRKMGLILRNGSDRARENAAAALVSIIRKGSSKVVAELASTQGIEKAIWGLIGSGTDRARRKATALLRSLRRWAAGLDYDLMPSFPTNATVSSTMLQS